MNAQSLRESVAGSTLQTAPVTKTLEIVGPYILRLQFYTDRPSELSLRIRIGQQLLFPDSLGGQWFYPVSNDSIPVRLVATTRKLEIDLANANAGAALVVVNVIAAVDQPDQLTEQLMKELKLELKNLPGRFGEEAAKAIEKELSRPGRRSLG